MTDQRIPVARLERYGRLENDVLKAGDEIKSLARFTSTQRTAFRKLLKKYKKWTDSTHVEDRFREEVLDDPKSFTKLDLGPLLDDYSTTLQQIRTLYEQRMRQQVPGNARHDSGAGSSTTSSLQGAALSGSKVDFDTAIAIVPLGENGTSASYFVHPENIVELQVLLLQHSRYCMSRSRSNSLNTPISASPQRRSSTYEATSTEAADYFAIQADDGGRFAKEQNALTINDRERKPGSTPQRARLCARWTVDDESTLAYRSTAGNSQQAALKRKHVQSFFDRKATFPTRKAALTPGTEQALAAIRHEYEHDTSLQPLSSFSSSRSRFVGTDNTPQKLALATLDTNIVIQKAGSRDADKSTFAFALLHVRQEGSTSGGLLSALEHSHLVERVPGFSLEYHAIWEASKPSSIPDPFWLPVLSRDIRKLPPPALPRATSTATGTPNSAGSVSGAADSTTAVDTARSDSVTHPEDLDPPPARSFRKKRRRGYGAPSSPFAARERYWSEYDHPEDGPEAGDPYVIYIDPNEKSGLERLFDRIGGLLYRKKRKADEESLLPSEYASPTQDESSDDESEARSSTRLPKTYGTLTNGAPRGAASNTPTTRTRAAVSDPQQHRALFAPRKPSMPQLTPIAFAASLVILAMAYILAMTGKKKHVYEVDFGVLFAIASSVFFSVVGFAGMLRSAEVSWPAWTLGLVVLVVDAVGSGGLLAWVLG